eukprot:1491637-Rhodomonas_salina.1
MPTEASTGRELRPHEVLQPLPLSAMSTYHMRLHFKSPCPGRDARQHSLKLGSNATATLERSPTWSHLNSTTSTSI